MFILLVEDDPADALAAETALQTGGFQVVTNGSSEVASQTLDERPMEIRALLTSVRLGNSDSGWQVARRARERNAQLPVAYMAKDRARQWRACGVPRSLLLTKPFAKAQVVTAVVGLLAGWPV